MMLFLTQSVQSMAFEIEWLESAQNDLDVEVNYVLQEFGYAVARKAYQRVVEHVARLASFPMMGIRYDGVTYKGFEVRKLVIRQVSVFYSPQTEKVTILAIWNNYQNPDNIPYHLFAKE